MQKHAHSQGDIQCIRIQRVGRLLIQLDQARGFWVRFVADGLTLVELEESGRINLT
jgi:hypothetical protein